MSLEMVDIRPEAINAKLSELYKETVILGVAAYRTLKRSRINSKEDDLRDSLMFGMTMALTIMLGLPREVVAEMILNDVGNMVEGRPLSVQFINNPISENPESN